MKKIYVLMAMLLGLFGSSAFAQDAYDVGFNVDLTALSSSDGYTVDDQSPLITDVWEQLYGEEGELNPCCDSGEGSEWALLGETKPEEVTNRNSQDFWHSDWHNGSQPGGSHYLQVMMTDNLNPDDLIIFAFTRRSSADNDHTTAWMVMGTDDPEADKAECEEIAYIETPFGDKSETILSATFKRGEYQYLRFYSEEETGASYGTRGYFHMSRFNIFPAVKLEALDEALRKMDALYNEYFEHYNDFDDRTGTDPGDYDEATVQAFIDVLDGIDTVDDKDLEAILAWCDKVKATYDAIAPTKVPFTAKNLPSGYYRIKAGMMYTNDGDDVEKYMCGYRSEGKLWGIWATPDFEDETDNIQSLWKITAVTDTTFDVQNMYHKGRFLPVTRSTNTEMSLECDSLLTFDAVATNHDDEISYVNIRLVGQAGNDGTYLHQGGHSNGSGVSGYLVGWYTTWGDGPKASEWYFEEVPADEAEAIINGFDDTSDIHKSEFISMRDKAPGMLEIAKDVQQVRLLTNAAQFSSPYSHNDQPGNGSDGGNLKDGVLIDGKTDTYWHSAWQNIPEGKHYLQVEMPEDFNAEQEIYMQFTRRNTNNNQITEWSFKGTNDPEAVEEDCEELATFESPWNSNNQTESFKSDLFKTGGYKYIRFYNEANNAGSVFFHLSEIQLAYDIENTQSQYIALGDIAKNLEALMEEFADYDMEEFEENDYERLKAAYDAFTAKYVDPTALRDTIALAESELESVIEGTNPGFYPAGSRTSLTASLEKAKAYDKAGKYSPAESAELLANFKAQLEALKTAPIKVQTGKWYHLRFGTEAEYDKYGWVKNGNPANYWIDNTDPDNPDTLGMYNAGNFGKYIAVAKRENEVLGLNDEGNEVNGSVIIPIAKEDVTIDKSIHGIDLDQLTDKDMALWRFVSIGDSAYAIQNKATGLYINNGGSLSVQPGLFTQHPSGYGQNAFFNKSLQGQGKSPLHLAQSQTVLCAWGNESGSGWTDADGRRGSFFVEEVENVAADFSTGGEFKLSLAPGDIYGRCYAVPLTLTTPDVAKLWTVDKIERTPDETDPTAVETVKVTFAQIAGNEVIAGRPFFIITEGELPSDDEYEPVIAKFNFTFDLVNKPQTNNYLKGTFDSKTIPVRFLTTGSGNEESETVLEWKNKDTEVGANRVYITDTAEGSEGFLRKAEFEAVFDATLADGINTTIKNLSRMGGIYTVDGRFVQNGNINTIPNLPKGAYIINGTKVIVK